MASEPKKTEPGQCVSQALETRRLLSAAVMHHPLPATNAAAGENPPVISRIGNIVSVAGTAGADTISASASGEDLIISADGQTQQFSLQAIAGIEVNGGAGNDTISLANVQIPATVSGAGGSDCIIGGGADDSLRGGGGNDTIGGAGGNDTIFSGAGNDCIKGGAGDDSVTSASGEDTIHGGTGDDSILCGSGDNVVNGNIGNDTIVAGAGSSELFTGPGGDSIEGSATAGDEPDSIYCGGSTDTILAGPDDDIFDSVPGDQITVTGSGTLSQIAVTPQYTGELEAGDTVQLTATPEDKNGNPATLPRGDAIYWASSNSRVATVSNDGLVTAVETGSAQIYAFDEVKNIHSNQVGVVVAPSPSPPVPPPISPPISPPYSPPVSPPVSPPTAPPVSPPVSPPPVSPPPTSPPVSPPVSPPNSPPTSSPPAVMIDHAAASLMKDSALDSPRREPPLRKVGAGGREWHSAPPLPSPATRSTE